MEPVPTHSDPQESTIETTGFLMYMLSFPISILYLAWAFLPEETLLSLGISYYPNKLFVTYLPAYLMQLVFVIALAYAGINMLTAPKFDSLATICDGYSKYKYDVDPKKCIDQNDDQFSGQTTKSLNSCWLDREKPTFESVSAIYDIDVADINRLILKQRS